MNLNGKIVQIGLSGGINSAAILCWLVESGMQPKELHLFYAHFREHSPDTFSFVKDCIKFARKHFKNVKVKITRNSVLDYFKNKKMIPHPKHSPCSDDLKIRPMKLYTSLNLIEVDLVGYVKHEIKRINKSAKYAVSDLFSTKKIFPIQDFTDEWCMDICIRLIGWIPKIYLILNELGIRVFKHNNCLPCKNATIQDLENVRKYYPEYWLEAYELSMYLKKYWGRDAEDYYTTFGKQDYETTCQQCKFS